MALPLSIAVAMAQTSLSEQFPGFWTYFQGLLFVVVVAFLPNGLATIGEVVRRRRGQEVSAAAVAGDTASLGVEADDLITPDDLTAPDVPDAPGSDDYPTLQEAAR